MKRILFLVAIGIAAVGIITNVQATHTDPFTEMELNAIFGGGVGGQPDMRVLRFDVLKGDFITRRPGSTIAGEDASVGTIVIVNSGEVPLDATRWTFVLEDGSLGQFTDTIHILPGDHAEFRCFVPSVSFDLSQRAAVVYRDLQRGDVSVEIELGN